jgi:hypothetical protein
MPFAIQLFFDNQIERPSRIIWQELVDNRIAPYRSTSSNQPQISLVLCEELDRAGCQSMPETLAVRSSRCRYPFNNWAFSRRRAWQCSPDLW